jgi:hypothetical protein
VKRPVFRWVCATDNSCRRFTEVAGPPYAASGDHPRKSELSKIRALREMEHSDRERHQDVSRERINGSTWKKAALMSINAAKVSGPDTEGWGEPGLRNSEHHYDGICNVEVAPLDRQPDNRTCPISPIEHKLLAGGNQPGKGFMGSPMNSIPFRS